MNRLLPCLIVLLGSCGMGSIASSVEDAVVLCRPLLREDTPISNDLIQQLNKYDGSIKDVMTILERTQPKNWQQKTGSFTNARFTAPYLKQKFSKERLNIFVPPNYKSDNSMGLIIFMHGGGGMTSVENIGYPAPTVCKKHGRNPKGFIEILPSAPWERHNPFRWNLERTDAYIEAVIEECSYRYNIDLDRVFLGGHSMGGYGAYHLVQRLSDRLAGGYAWAGAWKTARWDCLHGTAFFMAQGRNDAVAPGTPKKKNRPRWTDFFYAKTAHESLLKHGIPHKFHPYTGGHSMSLSGLKALRAWINNTSPRDPYFPHVVAVTPRGWGKWGKKAPKDGTSPHSRWLTIGETVAGTIDRDQVILEGPAPRWKETREDWDKQAFKHKVVKTPGALVDARYLGSNQFKVVTQNVKTFSIWLHPKMVDFSKKIEVEINGGIEKRSVQMNLLDAIRSYRRRRDWGLIYYCEVVFEI